MQPQGLHHQSQRGRRATAGAVILAAKAKPPKMKPAKETGITRAGLYKALSPNGNPGFETVTKIVGAFGMRAHRPLENKSLIGSANAISLR